MGLIGKFCVGRSRSFKWSHGVRKYGGDNLAIKTGFYIMRKLVLGKGETHTLPFSIC